MRVKVLVAGISASALIVLGIAGFVGTAVPAGHGSSTVNAAGAAVTPADDNPGPLPVH